MKVYLAGTGHRPYLKDGFYDFYKLSSYEYIKRDKVEQGLIHKYKDFIIDSGIFTYLNGKNTNNIDWEEYLFNYAEFVKKYNIKNYVEIDIDSVVGLRETERIREKLEKQVGWKCIPVWHMSRGYDKWLEICKDYDYICFGAFITDGLSKKQYPKIRKFLKDAEKEKCSVHGLGFTDFKWLRKLKFYSVDSSTWSTGNRFGEISKFKNGKIKRLQRPAGTKIKDHNLLSRHNFYEWIKYQKYAEINL